jgi:hypothetical protein
VVTRGERWNDVANVELTSTDVARTSSRRRNRAQSNPQPVPRRRRHRSNGLAIGPEPTLTTSRESRMGARRTCERGWGSSSPLLSWSWSWSWWSSGLLFESSSSTTRPNQPENGDCGTYLPAGWWVHHHAGCSPHLNHDDNVVVIRRPSPSSLVVEVCRRRRDSDIVGTSPSLRPQRRRCRNGMDNWPLPVTTASSLGLGGCRRRCGGGGCCGWWWWWWWWRWWSMLRAAGLTENGLHQSRQSSTKNPCAPAHRG